MKNYAKVAQAIASTALAIQVQGEATITPDPIPAMRQETTSNAATLSVNQDITLASRCSIPLPIKSEWTKADEKKFLKLAGREALGTITPDESRELENMVVQRRFNKEPRTPEEILFDLQQRDKTEKLIRALSELMTLYVTEDSPKASR